MNNLASRNFGLDASFNSAFKNMPEYVSSPPLADPAQARMIWQRLMQRISDKPADCDVDLRLTHQTSVMNKPEQKPRKHQANGNFWIDAGAAVIGTIKPANLVTQPTQIEDTINAYQNMFVWDELA